MAWEGGVYEGVGENYYIHLDILILEKMVDDNHEIIIYQTQDGITKIDVRMNSETLWLTQAQMVDLFQTSKQNISLHISNVFKEGELNPNSVVKEYLTTAADKFTNEYGEGTLIGLGKVTHEAALEKANTEYLQYKQKTIDELSPVEQEYFKVIKDTQKKLEQKKKKKD